MRKLCILNNQPYSNQQYCIILKEKQQPNMCKVLRNIYMGLKIMHILMVQHIHLLNMLNLNMYLLRKQEYIVHFKIYIMYLMIYKLSNYIFNCKLINFLFYLNLENNMNYFHKHNIPQSFLNKLFNLQILNCTKQNIVMVMAYQYLNIIFLQDHK